MLFKRHTLEDKNGLKVQEWKKTNHNKVMKRANMVITLSDKID